MNAKNDIDRSVWVTDIPRDASSMFGFTCEEAELDERAFIDLIRASKAGDVISPDRFPSEMWVSRWGTGRRKLKHIFSASGLFVVSAELAEILQNGDIGGTKLYPVKLYKKNRKTLYEGEYFFLNLCEKKVGFDPERSTNFDDRRDDQTERLGGMPGVLGHDQIAVSTSVLDGPDFWMDPTLFNSSFVKGALARELLDNKMFHSNGTEGLSIARCQVIGGRA